MGLDTSHDAWHGSYGSFSRWRDYLAEVAGYKFSETPYFPGSSVTRKSIDLDWSQFLNKNIDGEWDQIPEDPLLFIIVHSDCDGHLEPEHCGLLAQRLKGLLEKIPQDKDLKGHVGNVREKTQKFIDGLLLAYENNERLEFH